MQRLDGRLLLSRGPLGRHMVRVAVRDPVKQCQTRIWMLGKVLADLAHEPQQAQQQDRENRQLTAAENQSRELDSRSPSLPSALCKLDSRPASPHPARQP